MGAGLCSLYCHAWQALCSTQGMLDEMLLPLVSTQIVRLTKLKDTLIPSFSQISLSRDVLKVAFIHLAWFLLPRQPFVLLLEGQVIPTCSPILPGPLLELAQLSRTSLAQRSYRTPVLSCATRPSVMPSWVLTAQSCLYWMPCQPLQ